MLSTILFGQTVFLRCLERQLSSKLMMLADCAPDVSAPSDTESARVQTILKEPEAPGYWFHASKDGGRENHYRGKDDLSVR